MRTPKINEVLGISADYKIVKYSKCGDHDVAYLRRAPGVRTCPQCATEKTHIKGRKWRKVWHTAVRGVPLMLMIEVVRFQCPACKKTWNDTHEIIGSASIHLTRDAQDAILIDLMDKQSVQAVSTKNGPSRYMVNRVLDEAIVDNVYLPHTLCVDEFKANTEMGRMSVCIADGDSATLIEILPELTTKCLGMFFGNFTEQERARVKYFCCDMSRMFIRAQKDWFPHAVLCIDKFHVVKLVAEAFGDVRRRVQKDESLPAALRKEIRSSWKLFLMKPDEVRQSDIDYAAHMADRRIAIATALCIDDDELAQMETYKPREPREAKVKRLLELDSDLKCAYELMHLFREWSDMPWCTRKRDSLGNWISLANRSGIPEMKRAAKSIKSNREGILNGYRCNKTNATAEGLNNSIKVMKRMSYGFRTFARMRRRCLLSLGYYRIIRRGMKINGVRLECPKS